MNLVQRTPDELTTEKRKLVINIVSVSCIALIFVIGASLIKKIALGQKRTAGRLIRVAGRG